MLFRGDFGTIIHIDIDPPLYVTKDVCCLDIDMSEIATCTELACLLPSVIHDPRCACGWCYSITTLFTIDI
jgi:hypothetical protein